MINPINWKDHVVEYPNRFAETDLGGGLVQLVKSPGEVVQQGTPINAANLDNMDEKALQGIMLGLMMAQNVHQLAQKVESVEGEEMTVTLTNSASYPFNNSKKTVSLVTRRSTTDYIVLTEVASSTGGGVGEIRITDKLVNGFKIEHTGAATSVVVKCVIRGGN